MVSLTPMLCPNPSHNDPNSNQQAYITQATDSNYRIVFCPVCHYQVWLKHYNYSLTKQSLCPKQLQNSHNS